MLTLVALIGTVLGIASLYRLWKDFRVIDAAERLEAVNLSSVVRRRVPVGLRTQRMAEEIAIARQVMGARWLRWRRLAVVFGVVTLCSAATASFSIERNLKAIAQAQLETKTRLNLDVLKVIQGVWGWRADAMRSCSENPQTISVGSDRRTLLVRYAKPRQQGSETITDLKFDVIATKPDMLELTPSDDAPQSDPRTSRVYLQFTDENDFVISRSDDPMRSSGAIMRCPLSKTTKGWVH